MSVLRHYLTLALERSGVHVCRDVEAELSDLDAALAKVDRIDALEARIARLEAAKAAGGPS